LSFIESDLRINERMNLCIHVFESFKRDVGKPSYNLLRLHLGGLELSLDFSQLLNVRSKLRLLLNDKSHFPFELFVAHDVVFVLCGDV